MLFSKERQKSDCSFTLTKRAKEQKNEQKMSGFPNRSFFAKKKEQLLIIHMKQMLGNCSLLIFKRAIERLLICSLKRSE